jgi:hypothetical protein
MRTGKELLRRQSLAHHRLIVLWPAASSTNPQRAETAVGPTTYRPRNVSLGPNLLAFINRKALSTLAATHPAVLTENLLLPHISMGAARTRARNSCHLTRPQGRMRALRRASLRVSLMAQAPVVSVFRKILGPSQRKGNLIPATVMGSKSRRPAIIDDTGAYQHTTLMVMLTMTVCTAHRYLDDWLRSLLSRFVVLKPAGAHEVRIKTT